MGAHGRGGRQVGEGQVTDPSQRPFAVALANCPRASPRSVPVTCLWALVVSAVMSMKRLREAAKTDARFAHVAKDRRFRPIARREAKVQIDARFRPMLESDAFKTHGAPRALPRPPRPRPHGSSHA